MGDAAAMGAVRCARSGYLASECWSRVGCAHTRPRGRRLFAVEMLAVVECEVGARDGCEVGVSWLPSNSG